MTDNYVVSIAFEERDNLGVGYLASVLSESGYEMAIINFDGNREDILNEILETDPVLVGFSVIFQYHIDEFKELIKYLRKNHIDCHFTAGGHFASLRPGELFDLIPELDSLVRFEGEYTFLELVKRISGKEDWKSIEGLSFRENGELIQNKPRALEPDLDNFPFPVRKQFKEYALGKVYTTILAGRGCIHDCSFCDIREFYQQAPGPYKRIRKPERVIDEMEYLFNKKNCTVFLFQDDDFPVKTDQENSWIVKFCKELIERGLKGKVMWKINCRPDEIDVECFRMMKDHGLYLVFLGIEDGTDDGLKKINKNITTKDISEGIRILKDIYIGFDYGFMLYQPDSTFDSVSVNLNFLKSFCSDGYTQLTFLKMMPHFATRVEAELKEQDRLVVRAGIQDYNFLVRELDDFHKFVFDIFSDWLGKPRGFLNTSKWVRNYISVYSFYNESSERVSNLSQDLIKLNEEANSFFFDTMFELIELFRSGNYNMQEDKNLNYFRNTVMTNHTDFQKRAYGLIKKLTLLDYLKDVYKV